MRLADSIGAATGQPFEISERRPVSGGDINQAERLTGRDGRRFFVKLNRADRLDMFTAEAEGLAELARAGAVRVPQPVCTGREDGRAFLVLEFLDLDGRGDPADLGRRLARLHQTLAPAHGWHRDNTIGATPQPNGWRDDWLDFLREQRLGHQFRLAESQDAPRRLLQMGERLLTSLPEFFQGYAAKPSLLHGDLWGGNYGYSAGQPVLFDPAVYFGDREADLAMTELFGGFPPGFYAAYQETWPLDPGYATRKTLYNLYHILNHFNLFGGGYAGQAERMVARLLSDIGSGPCT